MQVRLIGLAPLAHLAHLALCLGGRARAKALGVAELEGTLYELAALAGLGLALGRLRRLAVVDARLIEPRWRLAQQRDRAVVEPDQCNAEHDRDVQRVQYARRKIDDIDKRGTADDERAPARPEQRGLVAEWQLVAKSQ